MSQSLAFYDLIPWIDTTKRIQIYYQDQMIYQHDVSDNPPTVRLISPNGGEAFDRDSIEIFWESDDLDNNDLTYFVQYSPDNGTNWVSIAAGLRDVNGIHLEDLSNVAGSTQAVFRVTVSDGVHTAMDQSDSVFSIPGTMPQAQIISPSAFNQYPTNAVVRFMASAMDLEDGVIQGEQLTWSSDREGVIGSGENFESQTLSPGIHTCLLYTSPSPRD